MITLELTPADALKLRGHLEWLAQRHQAAAPLVKNQAERERRKDNADDCARLARLVDQAIEKESTDDAAPGAVGAEKEDGA